MTSKRTIKAPTHSLALFVTAWGLSLAAAVQSTHAEALPIQPGSWTLAVLPDTQDYTEFGLPHFTTQTQWIADHAESHNIQFVLHEGDVTEHNNTTQWDRGLAAMSILDGVVPYAIAPGNHDYGPNGFSADRTTMFNDPAYFGSGTTYANQPTAGGFYEAGKTDNSYHTFNAGNQDWLVLALEWGPRDEIVTWANQVVENHPDHLAMLVTHAYMYYDESRYDWATKGSAQSWNPHSYSYANNPGNTINDGQELWDGLVSLHDNFRLTFSGHVIGDGTGFLSSAGDEGNVVHQMLANYQFKAQGGNGDMRLLEFLEDGETVIVKTYSPVLDRYDTAYDQQFSINLNELHEPLAPPVPPHAVVANLAVSGVTAPNDNGVGSVTVTQSSLPGVGTLQLNRGDYQVSVEGNGLEYQRGILLATVTQNLRDGIRASVEVGRNSYNDGLMALSVMQAGVAHGREVNFNNAVAWFDFRAGWQGAHVNRDGTLAADAFQGVEPSMVSKTATGRYEIDLGVDSLADGLLFAIANNNSNTVVQTAPKSEGSGWDIRVQNNASDFAAMGLDREFSFVYLPYETSGMIGGRFDGLSDIHVNSVGEFTMERISTGVYELSIAEHSPDTGMLLLTICDEYSDGEITAPNDNLLTYEPGGSGSFLIHSMDMPGITFEDSSFSWAFISFENPITLADSPDGDFDEDGDVDGQDFLRWQQGGSPNLNSAEDLTLWQASYAGQFDTFAAEARAIPEPSTQLLLVFTLCFASALRKHAH